LQLRPKGALEAALTAALTLLPAHALAVNATANITVSPTSISFSNVGETQQYFPASGAITVSGTLITKFGTGSIAILSPANITGTGGGTLPISDFSMTCSGTAQTGQTFAPAKTALAASTTTQCATYANGYNSNTFGGLNFTINLFLDDRALDDDSFPATNFTIVASAT
jgi:hypothetical protein